MLVLNIYSVKQKEENAVFNYQRQIWAHLGHSEQTEMKIIPIQLLPSSEANTHKQWAVCFFVPQIQIQIDLNRLLLLLYASVSMSVMSKEWWFIFWRTKERSNHITTKKTKQNKKIALFNCYTPHQASCWA